MECSHPNTKVHTELNILNNAIHHWKWPVETQLDTDQLQVDHAHESQIQQLGMDEEFDGFDYDSSLNSVTMLCSYVQSSLCACN